MAKKDPVFSKNEVMSDNTHADYCQQCKACTLWGIGDDPFSNAYNKSSCAMYPYPDHKPMSVIDNTGPCPFRVPMEG